MSRQTNVGQNTAPPTCAGRKQSLHYETVALEQNDL